MNISRSKLIYIITSFKFFKNLVKEHLIREPFDEIEDFNVTLYLKVHKFGLFVGNHCLFQSWNYFLLLYFLSFNRFSLKRGLVHSASAAQSPAVYCSGPFADRTLKSARLQSLPGSLLAKGSRYFPSRCQPLGHKTQESPTVLIRERKTKLWNVVTVQHHREVPHDLQTSTLLPLLEFGQIRDFLLLQVEKDRCVIVSSFVSIQCFNKKSLKKTSFFGFP